MLQQKQSLEQNKIKLIGDTLVLQDRKEFIVYAPFNSLIARIDKYPEVGSGLYNGLVAHGFFSSLPKSTRQDSNWQGFNSLTLLLTRNCNLRCIYCYASAGSEKASMPIDLAIGSLEWFVKHFNPPKLRITFHGGGEPTLEEELIKAVIGKASEIKGDRSVQYLVTTNGTAPKSFVDWLMKNKFAISISMDGPPETQDQNRPFKNGLGSSAVVEQNIRYLVSRNYPFTVRVTYSASSDITKIVEYCAMLGIKSIHLEPLFPYGRNYDSVDFGQSSKYEIYSPIGAELVQEFVRALEVSKRYGIRVYNSHLMHFTKGVGYFCGGACGRAMIVTHDGLLTGCLEVVDRKDKDIVHFKIGQWVNSSRAFEIDHGKISLLQKRHADELSGCQKCFARYTCAGGCAVKAVRSTGDFFNKDVSYCKFTRSIIPILVKRIAQESKI